MLEIKTEKTPDGIFIITLEGTFENKDIPKYLEFSQKTYSNETKIKRISVIENLTVTGDKVRDEMAKEEKRLRPKMEKASCVVGLTGLKKIIGIVYSKLAGKDLETFESIEEALEWLRS
jgi:nicotinamide mononucleotide (NMN) deamidase PncC